MNQTDAIIIGGGHNGLTCAGYLARAGLNVKVLEARDIVGGAAVTEEIYPGFKCSVCSYVVGMLAPAVIKDLKLEHHGLNILNTLASSVSLLPDGKTLFIGQDENENISEIAKFSRKDAENFPEFEKYLASLMRTVRTLAYSVPPNLGGSLKDIFRAAKIGRTLNKLSLAQQAALADVFTISAAEFLGRWFESDEVKGLFGFESQIGNFSSPYEPGTAYLILHHLMGEVNGIDGAWGFAEGGMGAIADSMARAAQANGASITTSTPVEHLLTQGSDNRVIGVQLADSRKLYSDVVVSSIHPQLLYQRLVDPEILPLHFRRRIAHWNTGSGTFRISVALNDLPVFKGLENADPMRRLAGLIDITPSLDYLERSYRDALEHGWAIHPAMSMTIPSLVDHTLAPKGKHVMTLFCQQFNPQQPSGRSWDEVKAEAIDTIFDTVEAQAPGFRDLILGYRALSPLDLEREFNLIGGDIFHGKLSTPKS